MPVRAIYDSNERKAYKDKLAQYKKALRAIDGDAAGVEAHAHYKGEGPHREDDLEEVNERFNEELDSLTEENADKVIMSLGMPSDILLAAGVVDKPMKLYGNKVIKKMKKHGFKLDELRNLPEAVANPIAVFDNYQKGDGSRSILTELNTKNGNFLVALSVGKGEDIDFNIVSSIIAKTKRAEIENEMSKNSLFSLPFFSCIYWGLNNN